MNYYKLGSGAGYSISGFGSIVRKAAKGVKSIRKVAHKVSPAHILYNKVTKTRQGSKQAAQSVARTRQAARQGNPVARRDMAVMQNMNSMVRAKEEEMGLPPPPPVPVEVPPDYYEESPEDYYEESEEYYDEE